MNIAIKTVLNVVGVIMILIGIVWILQGINILPGSFMTGQIKWAINGAISAVIGAALLFFANRSRKAG
jgi:uncharacterized membrane protein HdeD (DUF308 family)